MLSQDKKGLSIMIGYVLLVAIAIIMSLVVYQFIKTYIPRDLPKCPDGVSVFITEAKYVCGVNTLNLTIKNNGLFNVAGYFIRATTSVEQELATEDLSDKIFSGGTTYTNSVVFVAGQNSLIPNDAKRTTFDLSDLGFSLENHKIEIIPVRWQEEEGKTRFASCSGAGVEEVLSCWEAGTTCGDGTCEDGECNSCPEDCTHAECCGDTTCNNGETCGDSDMEPECNSDCGICEGICGDGTCDIGDGECNFCPDDCTHIECCPDTICNNGETCGTTDTEPECNSDCDVCPPPTYCGDEAIQTPNDDGQNEECDDGGTSNGDGCSDVCIIEADWVCIGEPSDCSYCNDNTFCETILGEDCLCSDCEGKQDGCGDGYMCEDGSCVEMTAVASCEQYCDYLGYNDALSFCASNCGGGCPGICEPPDEVSEHCNPENPSSPHYCCCVPF